VCHDTGSAEGEDNCSSTGGKNFTFHERRLLHCLLHEQYDPAVRPATHPGASVDVIVDSIIATIVDLVRSHLPICCTLMFT